MKRIAIITSGGDAPGMNACVRAVVRTALRNNLEVVGIVRAYAGMISGDFIPMDFQSVSNIIQRGGTILKSARCDEFRTVEGRAKAAENLKKHNIDGVVAIGKDGTFTGAQIFYQEHGIPFIGCPGTIDNDLFGTDNTIGYDTALNTVVQAVDKIRDTADAHDRLFFVEVMGRDAGHIALNSGIGAGAEEILIPEENRGLEQLLESLKNSEKSGKSSSIVVVAEGDKTGKNVFELASYVEQNLPYYEVRVSVLGHMQRGGAPSCFDRVLASRMGVHAVESLKSGKSNVMVGVMNDQMQLTPLEKAIKGKSEINQNLLRVTDILSI